MRYARAATAWGRTNVADGPACLPRGKAAGDEIVDKDAAGDDSDPER